MQPLIMLFQARLNKIWELQRGAETPERWREIKGISRAIETLETMQSEPRS